ncbi:BREX system P-loop protein BrxC [uncultured Ruminococcus sp.]|uniref:BREX system P-loop protein BrxC n=1 Tax=uncultured Ruminococcus sp. TaxID=165186 RepID=UPI0025E9E14A|nr:BREX system P-loop protein BrxC [uncultured Ruminococcus sp.]
MKLQSMYKADINRDINGVIKVAQDDERSLEQELREYIITKELRRHFSTFLNHYESSLEKPTDKIGVWISGFFGSGKSHFLKILSYLFENPVVAGKHAVDYFADKFDDPMMFGRLESCVKVPTRAILFNIDSKSPLTKDKTAILRVFAKVFYEHLGFYGNDLKVAKLEQFIAKSSKTEEFKAAFENVNGGAWEDSRDSFAFFEDDVVEAMTTALGISETAARNWFNGEEEIELSIEQLVKEIKEYIDSQGKDFRLLFMIDEVGQYIGSDSDLMLNLQTIVEEIGTKCGGRVWVMVTSQEAIDSITKISGNDFSKIQGRFNTRLSLSSSSVDEVIRKRILDKTDTAKDVLKLQYERNQAVLRNLFTFNGAVLDLKGYAGEGEFVDTYPFVPYQFRLMQNVLAQIRKHGNSGKHLSGGERSMLSGFQEAAQKIQEKDEHALIPFSLFYDTVHTFLESSIRRVIDRCQSAAENKDGIEEYDVSILKLLYLVRYVDDIKANLDNITVLMTDDIRADKITMRQTIQQSLDRLVSQNYVSRAGDTYTFLTDDEQDIAREIRNTPVNSAMVTDAIGDIIFNKLYVSKKFRYGKYDFAYDRQIDETPIGQLGGNIMLQFITVASEIYSTDDNVFQHKSGTNNAVMIVLSDTLPYFEELELAMKIRNYVKGKNVAQLPEAIQTIIRSRTSEASAHEKEAEKLITQSIIDSRIYVAGERLNLRISSVKDRIEQALSTLIESVYTKLDYIRKNYDSDAELLEILSGTSKQMSFGDIGTPNADAVKEVMEFLVRQKERALPTSMGDIQRRFCAIPYGWREIDIAAVVAEMIADGKITLKYAGNVIAGNDKKMPDYLRRKTEIDKAIVNFRVAPPVALIKKARDFFGEYFNCGLGAIPDTENELITYIIDKFSEQRDNMNQLLNEQYSHHNYPGKSIVEKSVKLCGDLLMHKNDSIALLEQAVKMQDDFLDNAEDISDVLTFFRVQKSIFDKAQGMIDSISAEKEYFSAEQVALTNISKIKEILTNAKPYRRISELPELTQSIQDVYTKLLNDKREEVYAEIRAAMGEIHQTASVEQTEIVRRADAEFEDKKRSAEQSEQLTALDAMKIQIAGIRQRYLQKLVIVEPSVDTVTMNRSTVCHTMKLQSEADIDAYVAEIKKTLMERLEGHDVLHII